VDEPASCIYHYLQSKRSVLGPSHSRGADAIFFSSFNEYFQSAIWSASRVEGVNIFNSTECELCVQHSAFPLKFTLTFVMSSAEMLRGVQVSVRIPKIYVVLFHKSL
jgi:hypothetical protein